MPAEQNPYQLIARLKKAIILADHLSKAKIGSRTAQEKMSRNQWDELAKSLQINPPSEETVQLVISLLAHRETPTGDPFGKNFGKEKP